MKYNWIFREDSFQCAKSLDGLNNVIEVIHWGYEVTDGSSSAIINGCNAFPKPTSEDFIPFEQLTKEEIISWLEASNDLDELKAAADNQLAWEKSQSNQEILPPPFEG